MASPTDGAAPRRLEYVRLDEVELAPRNPKLHDEAGIARAIKHHGFGEVPLRDERTGRLVAGHGRHAQLLAMHEDGATAPDGILVDDDGMWLMPLIAGWASRSDEDAEAYLVASNHLTTKGSWDDYALTEVLSDLAAANLLEVTGYDVSDFEAMEALFLTPTDGGASDDIDELAGQLGGGKRDDLWPALRLLLPPILHAAWKSHVDTHSGHEVEAFAALLGVDPAELPDPDAT